MPTEDSEDIYHACKVSDRLFILHPEFKRNNFYSQQLRVLGLVEAMVRHGDLDEGARNVAVVGAGVAGLTAAAALMTVNAQTTLIDRDDPLDAYRDATHRELHPNIIFWPFVELRAITDLPFLNWVCGPASEVRTRILDQWNRHFQDHAEPMIKATVTAFEEIGSEIHIHCKDRKNPIRRHRAIVCMGYEKDHDALEIGCPQYWGTPPQREDQGAVIVSGIGDGGLIDVAYQFYGTESVAVSRVLAYCLNGKPLKDDIKRIERESLDLANDNRQGASQKLANFYEKFTLARGDQIEAESFRAIEAPQRNVGSSTALALLAVYGSDQQASFRILQRAFWRSGHLEARRAQIPRGWHRGLCVQWHRRVARPAQNDCEAYAGCCCLWVAQRRAKDRVARARKKRGSDQWNNER